MSELKWCDRGGHAYASGKDDDERQYAETGEGRNGRRERIDVCGPCMRKGVSVTAAALVAGTVEEQ